MQTEVQPEFTTERLRLRAWSLDDLDFIVAMDTDPDVGRYFFVHEPPIDLNNVTFCAGILQTCGRSWVLCGRWNGVMMAR